MAVLYASTLLPEEMQTLLLSLFLPENDVWLLLTTPSRYLFSNASIKHFEEYTCQKDINPTSNMAGRVFYQHGELQWRRINGEYGAVFIGEHTDLIGNQTHLAECSHELEGLICIEHQEIFWGERSDDKQEWIEQIIPQFIVYPFSNCTIPRGRIAVTSEIWSRADGTPAFYRWRTLHETEKGGLYASEL